MTPLSILNRPAIAGLGSDNRDNAGQDEGGAPDQFARMLDAPPRADPPSPRPPAAANQPPRRESPRPRDRDNDDGERQPDRASAAGDRDDPAPRRASEGKPRDRTDHDGKDEDTRTASSRDGKPATHATSAAGESGDDAEEQADPHGAGSWPPAGLGGFGMMLLQGAAAPAATDAAPPAANTLAAGGNATAGLLPGLLDGNATAAATAGKAAGAGPIALPGLATSVSGAAATMNADVGVAQALATMAASQPASGELGASSDAGTGTADANATPFVLPTLSHTAPARGTEAAAPANPTPTPDLHGDGFDEAVGARLTWLAEQKIGHAHIKITPNDLGPVEVQLQMDGDKIHASFSAAHADVRQALEQSLPRLREMLGEHGFQLAHADVGAQQQGQRGEGNPAGTGPEGWADASAEDSAVFVPAAVLKARGVLDAYA